MDSGLVWESTVLPLRPAIDDTTNNEARAVFVFSRRAIQRCLCGLVDVLSTDQLETLAGRLNRVGADRLAASWEVCLLHSLSQVGTVFYEEPLGNGRKPDIRFAYRGTGQTGFLADITTISDAGRHNANPYYEFTQEVARRARQVGINPNNLGYRVEGTRIGDYGYQKIRLLLPGKANIDGFVVHHILPFLIEVRERRLSRHQIVVREAEASLTVSFDASQRFAMGSHPPFDLAYSPKNNPLWTKLRGKAGQLKDAESLGDVGVIVCDGGCTLLERRSPVPEGYSPSDIFGQFLREFPHISFVLLLRVEDMSPYDPKEELRIKAEFYTFGEQSDISRVGGVLEAMVAELPRPVLGPWNAYHRSREDRPDPGHRGGYTMGRGTIKISSRNLLELLAGRITPAEFNEVHGWQPAGASASGAPNPFERHLSRGETIREMHLEIDEDASNDWAIFKFGAPDPAISPFVVNGKARL